MLPKVPLAGRLGLLGQGPVCPREGCWARPSHSSFFLSTGFLRDFSVGVLASLYLESFSLCRLFSTQSTWNIFIYIYFFETRNNLRATIVHPGAGTQGLPCTLPASVAPWELPAFCLGPGFPERPEDDPPSLCPFNADTQVALL